MMNQPTDHGILGGPCTFAPFLRRRQSKTNFHQPHPTFHYSFWNFRSQIEKRKIYFTVRFGTSFSKSKSGNYFSLFVLELLLPNRKEKADLPQFVLKNRALFVLELALQIEERTLKQKLDSQFDTELGLEVK